MICTTRQTYVWRFCLFYPYLCQCTYTEPPYRRIYYRWYTISVEQLFPNADFSPFGIEIQPPLSEVAANGLCKALTFKISENETNSFPLAEHAYVTRSDTEGTALFVQADDNVHDTFGISKERYLGLYVKDFIDPAQKHDVVVEPGESLE